MLTIDYQLTGTGWSTCTICDGVKSVVVTASYLSDALGDLLSVALRLINGERRAITSFDEEPGEYRWIFEMTTEDMVHLTILKFEGLWQNDQDSAGTIIFQTNCTLKEFVSALFNASDKVLHEYGKDGYLQKWVAHKFPVEQYNDIHSWLMKNDYV